MLTSLRRLVAGAVMVLAASTVAQAVTLQGSLSFAGFGVTQNGTDLATSTQISATFTLVSSAGLGDFAPIPITTNFGAHTLDLSDLVGSFSLENASVGAFAATSASILSQSANFLSIVFGGIFTPVAGGLLDGFEATETTLRISINQSGESLSEAITMNNVPEPASMMLMLAGLAGIAAARRSALTA